MFGLYRRWKKSRNEGVFIICVRHEMDHGGCGRRDMGNAYRLLARKPESVTGRLMLSGAKIGYMRVWIGLIWLRIGPGSL
jgi:hypothetical protein